MSRWLHIVGKHLLGFVLYAMPMWIVIFTHMGFQPWNYVTPAGGDREGDAWLLLLAIMVTLWSVPGYVLVWWINRRIKPARHLVIWRALIAGLIMLGFFFSLFFLIGPFFSWLYQVLNWSGLAREKGWSVMMFAFVPLLSIVAAAWLTIFFPWRKDSQL